MGIEPRPDSRYLAETMGYPGNCRPKPSIIDRPNRKNRDRSTSVASDETSQSTQHRPHVRRLGGICAATELRPLVNRRCDRNTRTCFKNLPQTNGYHA